MSVSVPHYATCHTPIVVTGKQGSAPGEFKLLSGVAIHEDTHQIFVASYETGRVEIFSETGEFLHQLGVEQMSEPYGIAIHGDSVYVSCLGNNTVSKFSLTEMCRVRRIGGKGSNNGQFKYPLQLTTDTIGRVFIPDAITTESVYTTQISTTSVTSRISPSHDQLMLNYRVAVSTYCVQMTTRVCTY